MSELPKNQQHSGPINYQEKTVGNDSSELENWKKHNDDLNKKKIGRPPKSDNNWTTVGKD